ncbi:hypothetical protein CPB84DRAFT_1788272 [Gymnopilus junonius]|uniref:BTB domain-containing protein n=1 Tax=Gymnopilus junonius TaxID=109634 RepID=A0A9P5TK09_GYMJU|nr:hypothetical protein CPB84DRAFT_1788272 [Gymnopilus junonius]
MLRLSSYVRMLLSGSFYKSGSLIMRQEEDPPTTLPLTQYQSQLAGYTGPYGYPPASPSISSSRTGSTYSLVEPPLTIFPFSSSALADALTLSEPASAVEDNVTLCISTVFHPDALPTPDTLFSSLDGVIFYVHSQTILDRCSMAFEELLTAPLSDPKFRATTIELDAPSVELNVILHTLYGTSAEAHVPDIETLVNAVDRMPKYGLPPQFLILPSTPLYDLLLSKAPLQPLDIYALAAHHGLGSLAVTASSHLLSYDLFSITDAMAERITAPYLKKLMLLHAGRFKSLKGILLHPPHPHPPTNDCGLEDQKKLTRAWALVSAYLVWDSRPDLSVHRIQSTLNPLIEHVTCNMCHHILSDKVKDVLARWASVKCTI